MRKTFRLKNYSSTHFLKNTPVMVWPTKSLTKKSKKTFVKKTKIFSNELGTTLKKYKMHQLYFNTRLLQRSSSGFILRINSAFMAVRLRRREQPG